MTDICIPLLSSCTIELLQEPLAAALEVPGLFIMEIEETFGFKFALEEIAELDSVEKILRAVQKRLTL